VWGGPTSPRMSPAYSAGKASTSLAAA
jgi:hypothetical protein